MGAEATGLHPQLHLPQSWGQLVADLALGITLGSLGAALNYAAW